MPKGNKRPSGLRTFTGGEKELIEKPRRPKMLKSKDATKGPTGPVKGWLEKT